MLQIAMNYSNIIYAFDIETTTNENHITSHYLSNFVNVDFKLLRNESAEILSNISAPTFCRTAEDINNYLVKLNEQTQSQIAKYLGVAQPTLSRRINKIANHYIKFCKCIGEITADKLNNQP